MEGKVGVANARGVQAREVVDEEEDEECDTGDEA
jgi:hypothetical protein